MPCLIRDPTNLIAMPPGELMPDPVHAHGRKCERCSCKHGNAKLWFWIDCGFLCTTHSFLEARDRARMLRKEHGLAARGRWPNALMREFES